MKLKNKKILKKLSIVGTMLTSIMINANACMASGIGTQEVQTATNNIKRVITSIAMPLGRSSYFWKRCSSSD